jgi:molybdopterin-guanine dinucleotide biosynthesis protein A
MSLLKEQHDKLLAEKPEDVEHDTANCVICTPNAITTNTTNPEGGDMKTYTEDEFTAAVQEAVAALQAANDTKVADLQTKVDELTSKSEQDEFESQIADMQAKLDLAEAATAVAEKEASDIVAFLEDLGAKAVEAARIEDLKAARRIAIAEVTAFSDEQIDAKIDRWVAMDEETFDAILEDFKAVAAKVPSETETVSEETATETAMENVRDQEHAVTSPMAGILDARSRGLDVRDLHI